MRMVQISTENNCWQRNRGISEGEGMQRPDSSIDPARRDGSVNKKCIA